MEEYLKLLEEILTKGNLKKNRTGIDTIAIAGTQFSHEMSEGFPLLTTKKINFLKVTPELEMFIKGVTDKKFLWDRETHIWDAWSSKKTHFYNVDDSKLEEYQNRELGPIYGWQWRHFGAEYKGFDRDYTGEGIDQLANAILYLKTDPSTRRAIVNSWNPGQIDDMALPPCHYSFQLDVIGNKLNLIWQQRSVDVAIGLPFNIASYATLLHLIAQDTGFEEGRLVGQLGDTHIYTPHIERIKEQLKRKPSKLPKIITENFTSTLEWEYNDSKLEGYEPQAFIKYEIAV